MDRQMIERIPCFVTVCPNGCICLRLGVTSVHLHQVDFQALLKIMLTAAEHLGLEIPRDEPSRKTDEATQ